MTRHWNGERWFTAGEVENAIAEARLAIDEYYNGNRQEAEIWLLTAYDANQDRARRRFNEAAPSPS